jgi:hypothetical protein
MQNLINTIIATCVSFLENAPSLPGSRQVGLFPVIEVSFFGVVVAAVAILVMILAEVWVSRSK